MRIIICDSIWRIVSSATPTTISTEVPPSAREVAFERLRLRAEVEGRADDTDEAIKRRLDNYHRETEPLIEHYRTRGNLVPIRGHRTENEVFADIQAALEQVPA